MKILFFGLILIFSLIVGITTTSDSFAEKSKAYYIDKIEKTIPLIPQVNITKNDFDTSHEMDYPFARAWNDTMYVTYLDEEVTSAHDWWTGITLYRIGEINPISGTYEVDFNYWIQVFERNDTVNFQNNESFSIDFVNSAETPEIKVSKGIKHKSHYYDIRVNGVFYSDMDFTKFPFEKLNLKIKIEPGNIDAYDIKSDSVQFHRWPFPVLAEEGVPSPEYKIIDYKISTYNHTYSEGDTYSRYLAEFQIQRDYSGAFLKYLFPIIVMVGLAGAALIFPSEEYMTKIELNAIFLLGILFYLLFFAQRFQ